MSQEMRHGGQKIKVLWLTSQEVPQTCSEDAASEGSRSWVKAWVTRGQEMG